jgi:hypothetical protein
MASFDRVRAKRTTLLVGVVTAVLAASALHAMPASATGLRVTKQAASTTCADPSGSVKVGLVFFGGVASNVTDLGGGSLAQLSPSDQAIVENYNKGIDALNAAGGLAGCQVEAVIHNFSAASPDFNQESQKECTSFTQDNKVIAVYTAAFETKVAFDCLAKAKTPVFAFGGSYPPTCADYKKYSGYIYSPVGVATCRFGSFIGIWNKAGLFPKGAKVGILALDDGSGQGAYVANKIYMPALKKLKIPSEMVSFPGATSESSATTTSAALGNAILKFKTDGVNVVIMTPNAAQGPAFFMPQAASQSFFPNYGLNSGDMLSIASAVGGSAIKTGIAISWSIADLPLAVQQALPTNSAITTCAAWSAPTQTTVTGSSAYCDFLNILQAAFKGATKTDPATLQKGIDALGQSFVSSVTYGGATKFAKGRYDGVTVAQVLKFNPTNKAFELLKPNQKVTPIP